MSNKTDANKGGTYSKTIKDLKGFCFNVFMMIFGLGMIYCAHEASSRYRDPERPRFYEDFNVDMVDAEYLNRLYEEHRQSEGTKSDENRSDRIDEEWVNVKWLLQTVNLVAKEGKTKICWKSEYFGWPTYYPVHGVAYFEERTSFDFWIVNQVTSESLRGWLQEKGLYIRTAALYDQPESVSYGFTIESSKVPRECIVWGESLRETRSDLSEERTVKEPVQIPSLGDPNKSIKLALDVGRISIPHSEGEYKIDNYIVKDVLEIQNEECFYTIARFSPKHSDRSDRLFEAIRKYVWENREIEGPKERIECRSSFLANGRLEWIFDCCIPLVSDPKTKE
jgi:hypothetical protein